MPVNHNELTKEMIMQALKCKNADELIALAKTGGIELTKEEAESYMTELADFELDENQMQQVAGGVKTCYMVDGCAFKCGTLKDC
ncbi:MAG: DUF2624 family protein [Succiniclasticum sp.]|jgi:hypothetical protein|uniref:Nif11-like leader peptide domain-containing protein n=1 Tax=Succiniclasticum ruminis TaxID=40841 RepID=A0A1G6NIR4_9FIRM|nr:DUF2624 family protein [Succiniclasticum ruminis]MBQ1777128.1 DUF2624 family protein [Acidaminococcaceae bacterium]MEE3395961.1 DUF2624 family protein [Succiniclasticum sp.]MBQ2140510.1 DUF2624 family protein [Acidaminococcaceae bacterium]MBQ2221405.1 DUF2624 family protein [Acidaminococcaceae bacterium]MBQ2343664.1 DUF2624 family protein [Acidaminococcaceae bacterium]